MLRIRRGQRALNRRMMGDPSATFKPSLFAGDPVEVTQDVAEAVAQPALIDDAVASAVVDTKAPSTVVPRVSTFEEMTPTQKADVVAVEPVIISNATITQKPVVANIPASVLNYHYLRTLTDYASAGLVLFLDASPDAQGNGVVSAGPAVGSAQKYPGTSAEPEQGYKAIPCFKFTITASVLNSRPGNYYSVYVTGFDVSGATVQTPVYSFTRIDYVVAVMGYFIPFKTISNRTVPVLLLYSDGSAGTTAQAFQFHVSGLAAEEQVIVVIPGYGMAETRDMAELFSLPAGVLLK